MTLRVTLFLVLLLLLSISQVSISDSKIDEEEEQIRQLFTRVPNRRLIMPDIVLRLANYINLGGSLAVVQAPAPAPGRSGEVDCGGLCKYRCSLHSRANICRRACGTCCVRCKCVPPGTFGNRDMCGKCYTDMTTHRNKTKCP
ncbi:hypothetical protein M9H77_04771 [Catharanthus roseus]|uniref:Uncharacterized protein n=1 Tax=Catharanthus roseus TaxID=4058 RepID=A0ACC0CEZ7_CATRO|nr:hypothetical protein M9H77_04771 [Catharanthus roseus]